jgi:hypothetical protein
MKRDTLSRALVLGASFSILVANAVTAEDAVDTKTKGYKLPACRPNHDQVSLQILTKPNVGWIWSADSDGGAVHALSDGAWILIPPSQWVGPKITREQNFSHTNYTYTIHFNAPGPRGQMMVSAQWSADNCGVSLQAGTGTPVPTGACNQGDEDFVISHMTTASFAAADSTDPYPSITFKTTNQPATVTGLTGIFTVTADCLNN